MSDVVQRHKQAEKNAARQMPKAEARPPDTAVPPRTVTAPDSIR